MEFSLKAISVARFGLLSTITCGVNLMPLTESKVEGMYAYNRYICVYLIWCF